jgi:diaminopimelate decarboxylase
LDALALEARPALPPPALKQNPARERLSVLLARESRESLLTPGYVFDPQAVLRNLERLRRELGTGVVVSLKANPNLDLFVRCAHAFTDGVEIASLKELDIVAGRTAVPKFANSPAMDEEFMRAVVAARVIPVLDNPRQLELLAAASIGRPAKALIRINARALCAGQSGALPKADHFGVDPATACELARRAKAHDIEILGVHVFGGSHGFRKSAAAIIGGVTQVLPALETALGGAVRIVNLGGGFAEAETDDAPALAAYASSLAPLTRRVSLLHESGRRVFASAGAFVTRVVATKTLDGRRVVICDGGISHNFLLCQTENVLRKYRAPVVLPGVRAEREASANPILFVGPSCSQNDVIGQLGPGSLLPAAGDLCVFENCGAYNSTYTASAFLSAKTARHYLM